MIVINNHSIFHSSSPPPEATPLRLWTHMFSKQVKEPLSTQFTIFNYYLHLWEMVYNCLVAHKLRVSQIFASRAVRRAFVSTRKLCDIHVVDTEHLFFLSTLAPRSTFSRATPLFRSHSFAHHPSRSRSTHALQLKPRTCLLFRPRCFNQDGIWEGDFVVILYPNISAVSNCRVCLFLLSSANPHRRVGTPPRSFGVRGSQSHSSRLVYKLEQSLVMRVIGMFDVVWYRPGCVVPS